MPWLTAFMVFLAALALSGMLSLHGAVERWDAGVDATLTVQLAPGANPEEDEKRLSQVLAVLAGKPGIERYETLSRDSLVALIEPWIGASSATGGEIDGGDLPLPQLIDVTLTPGGGLDAAALARELAARVPGTAVDDHRVWLSRLVELVAVIEIVAWGVLGLIAFATVGTVVFTTRTGIAIHREAIEVLHLIGAQDSYIAQQFAARALGLGLKGGILGLLLAVPTLALLVHLTGQIGDNLVPDLDVVVWHMGLVLALPVLVALLAMVTAKRTVMRNLSRMW